MELGCTGVLINGAEGLTRKLQTDYHMPRADIKKWEYKIKEQDINIEWEASSRPVSYPL